MITGASGGVGVAAVQLASAMGLTVVALSRNEEKQHRLIELGATIALDPTDVHWREKVREAVGPAGVKLAIDNIGGKLFLEVIDVLGEQGRLSLVGNLADPVPKLDTGILFSRRIRIAPMALGYYTVSQNHEAWKAIANMLERTGARPEIDSIFPFRQLPEAFERLGEGPMDKVLLKVNSQAK